MNDIDAAIASELERMVPVEAEPDWDAIARDAGLGRRRGLSRSRRQLAARPRQRRLLCPSRLLGFVAALAAAAVLVLVAPWDRSGGSLSDLALAAVGSQPVLHVVAEFPTGVQAVEIATGASLPVLQEQEIWYDADRGLKKTVVRVGSTTLDVMLETSQGGYTAHGIVYDCAWIAAHPVEATKARVSCNASGDNGTRPRVIPRPKPTLDPGLSGFVDGYRRALAAGQAREAGSGDLEGKTVDWLVFRTSDGSERVALDAGSHKPVLLVSDHGLRLRIGTIETIPYAATDFSRRRPEDAPVTPSYGKAMDAADLPLEAKAIAAAMPNALWAGQTLNGLPLVKADRQTLRTTFVGDKPPLGGTGLELEYGSIGAGGRLDRSQPYVRISESPGRDLAFGNQWSFTGGNDPADGQVYVNAVSDGHHQRAFGPDGKPLPPSPPLALGFAVVNGVYVTIETTTPDLVLAAARALQSAD